MREPAFSKAEENFAKSAIFEGSRLDGRSYLEMRKCSIEFGQEFGTCVASIGNTRALAHVSCSLDRPSEVRPSEGKIVFKVELPPLASPSFELNKKSAFAIDLNRLLEKAIVQRCLTIAFFKSFICISKTVAVLISKSFAFEQESNAGH